MATISLNDVIFATIRLRGTSLATISVSGVTTFAEILSRLISSLSGRVRGLATIELRNASQGWAARRNVMLNCA